METERLPLKDLIPYEKNAKKHPQYHVDQIKRSIEQFGNIDPIAIDENNMILEGHGRVTKSLTRRCQGLSSNHGHLRTPLKKSPPLMEMTLLSF